MAQAAVFGMAVSRSANSTEVLCTDVGLFQIISERINQLNTPARVVERQGQIAFDGMPAATSRGRPC